MEEKPAKKVTLTEMINMSKKVVVPDSQLAQEKDSRLESGPKSTGHGGAAAGGKRKREDVAGWRMASAAAGGGGLPCTALSSFFCKITEELMRDPVCTADGQTHEREAIEEWFEGHDTSPPTNLVFENKRLNPNIALRGAIEEWKETYEMHLSMANIDWDSRNSRVESGPKAIGKGGKYVQELSSTRVSEFVCLLDDPMSADFTFVVNSERIPAHENILAARSPYFRDMLEVTEAQGGSDIIMQDTSPAGFGALLLCLYTDELVFDETLEYTPTASCAASAG